jgi:hypothetical protein
VDDEMFVVWRECYPLLGIYSMPGRRKCGSERSMGNPTLPITCMTSIGIPLPRIEHRMLVLGVGHGSLLFFGMVLVVQRNLLEEKRTAES